MHSSIHDCLGLTGAGIEFLTILEQQMSIVADLSRADILMYCRKSEDQVAIVSHARPHSLAHVYTTSREGRVLDIGYRQEVSKALISGKRQKDQRSFISEGAPVVRQALPVYFPPPCDTFPDWPHQNSWPKEPSRVVATLIVTTNLIEYERHRLRSEVYRRALKKLQGMLLCGHITGAEELSPFGEQDGIIYTDSDGIIRYSSGIAANLYRRIGYKEALVGRHLAELETGDEQLRREALAQKRCLEWEAEESDRHWTRKAIPLVAYPSPYLKWLNIFNIPIRTKTDGVLILLHDDTEIRRRDQEMRLKNAMIQEVHHRVKNNLQTIAGLLRMQIRRVQSDEARQVLDEALNRILSVAVIHEFLSSKSSSIINIKEVSGRILNQLQQGILSPDKVIRFEVSGESIHLPARQATACSLIINELVQNAIEHGFERKKEGVIRVNLEDTGEEVIISVIDNGDGVPDDFTMEQANSLGLQIVKILVEGDLQGKLDLSKRTGNEDGLCVKIIFPKSIFTGEEGWKEHVSL